MRLPSARASALPRWRPRIFFSDDMPVSYLPSQIDGEAASSSLNFRSSPWKLLCADIKLVVTLIPWILLLCVPGCTTNPLSELYPSWANFWQLVLHLCLSGLGLVWLLAVAPIALGAPGIVFLLFMGLYCAITALFCIPLDWGPRVVESAVEGVMEKPGERWLYVNGIITGKHWLQANVDMISSIFHRPVEGIHNWTYGLVFDLIECLVQRCFSYSTRDTRVLYDHLKSILLDPATEKCVVIVHSQGGIILSTVLDSLFADIPSGAFRKMEIYTFGCAANHFNNPVRFVPTSHEHNVPSTDPQAPEERLIQHIEHYCNEYDFVARFGVLHFTGDKLANRFVGKVFQNKGQPGHLLNQHYLDIMFAGDNPHFLDTVVDVEQEKAVHREEAAGAQQQQQLRSSRVFPPALTEFRMASAQVPGDLERARTLGRSLTSPAQLGVYDFAQQAMVSAESQRGRTVRELSRLWRYKSGKSPGSLPIQGRGRRAST